MPSVGELAERYIALARDLQSDSQTKILIPASIFSTSTSPLRALVTYLKNVEYYSFNKIATTLGRSYPTIYAAYDEELPPHEPTDFYIPLDAFNTDLSILETCVVYLKERYDLNLSVIGRLLNKSPKTMWATESRAKNKRGGKRA